MRVLTNVLVVLAALCFAAGALVAVLNRLSVYAMARGLLPAWSAETWWRGMAGLLLFAITLMMMERRSS